MAAKAGESKQTLIIFLVIFVLLTITLGVTTYLGFDGQKKLDTEAATAKSEKAKVDKLADWYRFQALQYRSYIGAPLAPEEQTGLETLRSSFGDQANGSLVTQAELDKFRDQNAKYIREELDAKLGYDPVGKKPVKTMGGLILEQQEKIKELTTNFNNTKSELDAANNSVQSKIKELEGANENYKKQLADLKAASDKNITDYLAQIDNLQRDLQKYGQNNAEFKNVADQEIANLKKESDKLKKQLVQGAQAREKLEKLVPKTSRIDLDQSKGKVLSLDRVGKIAYIDLGSADNVRPGLTFRIAGPGASGNAKDEKGSLEVIKIISEHQSQCNVTEVIDSVRNPVLIGDLLYNPAWSPSLKKHVAIAGIIDLTGEKKDGTPEFIRNLTEKGIVVDAYVDLKELAIKGEITRTTEYLILADAPQQARIRLPKDREEAYEAKVSELIKAGNAYAVTSVPLREFLTLTGYRLPKVILEREDNYEFRLGGAAPAPLGGPNDKREKEKEAAKDASKEANTEKPGKNDKGEQNEQQ